MNRRAKGSRNERKARDILKGMGYDLVIKAGASLGVFDLIGLSCEYDHANRLLKKRQRDSNAYVGLRAFASGKRHLDQPSRLTVA